MGRPGLSNHPKFLRLARALGSEALARGSLELMWEVSYESGDPRLGDAEGVEAAARWRGDAGVLFAALRDAGGPGRLGFVEPDETGEVWLVHDLFDHAPDYVRKRARREDQRRASGRTLAAERRSVTSRRPENGSPPAPTPAPAPNYIPPAGAAGTGQAEFRAGAIEPSGAAEELPLGFQVAPGALVAARERKRQAKVANASEEASTTAPRRQLSDALVSDWLEVRGGGGYEFDGGRDGQALGILLARTSGDVMEIRRRWRWGIDPRQERDGGPPWSGRLTLIAHLKDLAKWNALDRAPALPGPASNYEGGVVENRF